MWPNPQENLMNLRDDHDVIIDFASVRLFPELAIYHLHGKVSTIWLTEMSAILAVFALSFQ